MAQAITDPVEAAAQLKERVDAAGKGTWARVQKNLAMLQKAGADCNLLCVVTRRCAKSAVRCYHAMQKTDVRFLQFIPCLDPLGETRPAVVADGAGLRHVPLRAVRRVVPRLENRALHERAAV